jgi:hypothetical protein
VLDALPANIAVEFDAAAANAALHVKGAIDGAAIRTVRAALGEAGGSNGSDESERNASECLDHGWFSFGQASSAAECRGKAPADACDELTQPSPSPLLIRLTPALHACNMARRGHRGAPGPWKEGNTTRATMTQQPRV